MTTICAITEPSVRTTRTSNVPFPSWARTDASTFAAKSAFCESVMLLNSMLLRVTKKLMFFVVVVETVVVEVVVVVVDEVVVVVVVLVVVDVVLVVVVEVVALYGADGDRTCKDNCDWSAEKVL